MVFMNKDLHTLGVNIVLRSYQINYSSIARLFIRAHMSLSVAYLASLSIKNHPLIKQKNLYHFN